MEITLNNLPKNIPDRDKITASQLVTLAYPGISKGIALAIGENVISREKWDYTEIFHGDNVLIFKATQGG